MRPKDGKAYVEFDGPAGFAALMRSRANGATGDPELRLYRFGDYAALVARPAAPLVLRRGTGPLQSGPPPAARVPPVLLLELVLLLMICAVALGWLARHFKFPYPIALVVGGALLGLVLVLYPRFVCNRRELARLAADPGNVAQRRVVLGARRLRPDAGRNSAADRRPVLSRQAAARYRRRAGAGRHGPAIRAAREDVRGGEQP